MSDDEVEALASQINKDLLKLYGSPVISGEQLQKALAFRSIDSLRQAITRKTVPVPVFDLANRKGKYALVKDIALYLAEQARKNDEEVNKDEND